MDGQISNNQICEEKLILSTMTLITITSLSSHMTVTFMLSNYYFFTLYDVLQKRSNVLQKLGHCPANMVREIGKSEFDVVSQQQYRARDWGLTARAKDTYTHTQIHTHRYTHTQSKWVCDAQAQKCGLASME